MTIPVTFIVARRWHTTSSWGLASESIHRDGGIQCGEGVGPHNPVKRANHVNNSLPT
ncbi:hypothetical protein DSO57_1029404, partial [Entomophthora muscae]